MVKAECQILAKCLDRLNLRCISSFFFMSTSLFIGFAHNHYEIPSTKYDTSNKSHSKHRLHNVQRAELLSAQQHISTTLISRNTDQSSNINMPQQQRYKSYQTL
ncbi:hypothetical protein HELRODRAFT_173851 [Helobdella robusta]|uniref:Uncharacterized protein n=1 Tax=Helobdella robusta TaxID=6412 RepID=T1F7B1_HELRO|nr:hypothetical protein HELRODRAFT_173851 [Helobdella robusta]ESO03006.1 hypothetical protein HELRODRAFT_173851 [Helobdella robusta]